MTKEKQRNKTFIFLKSYYRTFCDLKTKKEQNLYVESILSLGFFETKNEEDLNKFDEKIEEIFKKCDKYPCVKIALNNDTVLIRNNKINRINGYLGKDFGRKGGAPRGNQNARKNNPQTTPDIEEEKEIDKDKRVKNKSLENDLDVVSIIMYGKYENVALTKAQYNNMQHKLYNKMNSYQCIKECTATNGVNILIDELSYKINKNEIEKFNPNNLNKHYLILIGQFLNQKFKDMNTANQFIDTCLSCN